MDEKEKILIRDYSQNRAKLAQINEKIKRIDEKLQEK